MNYTESALRVLPVAVPVFAARQAWEAASENLATLEIEKPRGSRQKEKHAESAAARETAWELSQKWQALSTPYHNVMAQEVARFTSDDVGKRVWCAIASRAMELG